MAYSFVIPPNTRDLSPDVIGDDGRLKIMPSSFYRGTTKAERSLLALRHGAYVLPTTQMIAFVRHLINRRSAIEVGAGNGVVAEALGIRATDSRQQEEPAIAAYYARQGQPTIPYGKNIERSNAKDAIAAHKPDVVLACWVTHLYDPAEHYRKGNESGVDEEAVVASCKSYIFVGNHNVHANKKIWRLPHRIIEPNWLFSRSGSDKADFIAVWGDTSGL